MRTFKQIFYPSLCILLFGKAAWAQNLPISPNQPSNTTTAPLSTAKPSLPVAVPLDYRLDTGDTISIRVARHDDVSGNFLIPADGLITLVRLDAPMQTRGKTCAELSAALLKALSGELRLRANQVVVSVIAPRMRRVYIQGNAIRSGEYDLKNGWRVSELVAVAGGVTQPDRIRARLLNPNRPNPLVLNIQSALDAPESSPDNLPLKEGDSLILDLPTKKRFFVKGEGPKGIYEIDERFGLKRTLIQLGFSTTNATGALRKATIVRNTTPGDPNSPETRIPVDLYTLLTDDNAADLPLKDLDTLEIPLSERFVYVWGEIGGQRKWYMPEDRPTHLLDLMSNAGGTSGQAKIGEITIWSLQPDGSRKPQKYDYGRFLSKGDDRDNPEIHPQDIVYVPNVKRPDVGSIWTIFGLRNILKTFVPGLP